SALQAAQKTRATFAFPCSSFSGSSDSNGLRRIRRGAPPLPLRKGDHKFPGRKGSDTGVVRPRRLRREAAAVLPRRRGRRLGRRRGRRQGFGFFRLRLRFRTVRSIFPVVRLGEAVDPVVQFAARLLVVAVNGAGVLLVAVEPVERPRAGARSPGARLARPPRPPAAPRGRAGRAAGAQAPCCRRPAASAELPRRSAARAPPSAAPRARSRHRPSPRAIARKCVSAAPSCRKPLGAFSASASLPVPCLS